MSGGLLCDHRLVQAALRSVSYDPEPSTLSADPADFAFQVRLIIGPNDGPGEESLDLTVCTPQWLAAKTGTNIYWPRHHLVVNVRSFSKPGLEAWLEAQVQHAHGDSWAEIGERLGRLGYWEFEDHEP